jgi:gamma-glutamylaminecyclotransferase
VKVMSDRVRLFVYGTLMSGEPNAEVLAGSSYIGSAATTAAYRLVALAEYPGLLAGGQTSVKGELYLVDDQVLAALDGVEDCPSLFQRGEIELADGGRAQAYLGADPSFDEAPTIPSGDWRKHQKGR